MQKFLKQKILTKVQKLTKRKVELVKSCLFSCITVHFIKKMYQRTCLNVLDNNRLAQQLPLIIVFFPRIIIYSIQNVNSEK